jgi:hypothetical protein
VKAINNTSGYEQQQIIADLKKIDPESATNAGWK